MADVGTKDEKEDAAGGNKTAFLTLLRLVRKPSLSIVVVDNFYENPMKMRNFVLEQDFRVFGNYPGMRTISFATEELKKMIQQYLPQKITRFKISQPDDAHAVYNGAFQLATSRCRSWIHLDPGNNFAGVLFLTPDAPVSAGTGFYKFYDGTMGLEDQAIMNNKIQTDMFSQDMTKWQLVDQVGNVFNRLVLFDSTKFHMSLDFFGCCKEDGRIFQVFFFDVEK